MNTTALHDQALAAFDEAARTVKAIPSAGVKRTPITGRILTKWALGLGDGQEFYYGLLRSDVQHEWTSCGHLEAAQQCFGLATLPGHLMCGPCWLTAAERSPSSCDWCAGVADEEVTVWPAIYAIGPAVVLLMVCDHHLGRGCELLCCGELRKHVRETLLNIADTSS